jgi:hypothetical protein
MTIATYTVADLKRTFPKCRIGVRYATPGWTLDGAAITHVEFRRNTTVEYFGECDAVFQDVAYLDD